MKLESQCVSLELAKKLKELGFNNESYFIWDKVGGIEETHYEVRPSYNFKYDDEISAYTVAELGQILYEVFEKNGWDLIYDAYGEVFNFKGTQRIGEIGIINLMRNPNMGAKMLIYLKENNLI